MTTAWTNETQYGGGAASTWDGADLGDGLNTWDSATDSWDGHTLTIWTNETRS